MSYKGPPPMTKEEIYEFMREIKIARLCTVNRNGSIHSVPVWFTLEGKNILIFTPENSQKAKNIQRNNKITVLIDNQEKQTKGVIVYGEAKFGPECTQEEAQNLFHRYMDKEKVQKYWKGAKSLARWMKITVKPLKFASFDYFKDKEYAEAMGIEFHE